MREEFKLNLIPSIPEDTPRGLTRSSEEDAQGAPGWACLQSPELVRGGRGSRGCSEGFGAGRVEGKENFFETPS